jgi:hypothetical protein
MAITERALQNLHDVVIGRHRRFRTCYFQEIPMTVKTHVISLAVTLVGLGLFALTANSEPAQPPDPVASASSTAAPKPAAIKKEDADNDDEDDLLDIVGPMLLKLLKDDKPDKAKP